MTVVLVLVFAAGSIAHADVNMDFSKIKNELLAKGLSSSDVNAIENPAKSLLAVETSPVDIKNAILDFAAKGFKGTSLGSLMDMVNDLVKNGDSLKLAQMVVGQAADKAKASDAKGDALISKIQELVKKHTEQVKAVKSKTSGWGSILKTTK